MLFQVMPRRAPYLSPLFPDLRQPVLARGNVTVTNSSSIEVCVLGNRIDPYQRVSRITVSQRKLVLLEELNAAFAKVYVVADAAKVYLLIGS